MPYEQGHYVPVKPAPDNPLETATHLAEFILPVRFKRKQVYAQDRTTAMTEALGGVIAQAEALKARIATRERAVFAADQLQELEEMGQGLPPSGDVASLTPGERADFHAALNEMPPPPQGVEEGDPDKEKLAALERQEAAYTLQSNWLRQRAEAEAWFTSNVRNNGGVFKDELGNEYHALYLALTTDDEKGPNDFYEPMVLEAALEGNYTREQAENRIRHKYPVLAAARDAETLGYNHLGMHPCGGTHGPVEVRRAAYEALQNEIDDRAQMQPAE